MKQVDRQERRKKIIVIFLGLIMILSAFGVSFYGFSKTENKQSYGKYSFYQVNGWWMLKLKGQQLYFSALPQENETIVLPAETKVLLSNKLEIDTTYDLNSTYNETFGLIQYQMQTQLRTINVFVRNGLTTNTSYQLPVITCEKATAAVPVIYFRQSNISKVTLQNNCLIAEGKSTTDLMHAADKISYILLGIIQ